MKNKYLISVVGPTAIGKTSMGIKVAEHFQTKIISADSRQFFKEMKIGTAVPSHSELSAVPHHFIQYKSVTEKYSVGDFEREALELLDFLFQKKDVVVMVGGSGLYVNAVTKGLNDFPKTDPQIRVELNSMLRDEGIEVLQRKLKKLDPDYYGKVDKENPHRLIRALEICIGSGKPYSSFLQNEKSMRSFKIISIGLDAPREIVYDRINQRVDNMMEEGLLKEVSSLQEYKEYNALNTVGYKELFQFLNDEIELKEAVSEIKKNTRRFAKRQLTWFRKDNEIEWFSYDTAPEEIINFIKTSLRT